MVEGQKSFHEFKQNSLCAAGRQEFGGTFQKLAMLANHNARPHRECQLFENLASFSQTHPFLASPSLCQPSDKQIMTLAIPWQVSRFRSIKTLKVRYNVPFHYEERTTRKQNYVFLSKTKAPEVLFGWHIGRLLRGFNRRYSLHFITSYHFDTGICSKGQQMQASFCHHNTGVQTGYGQIPYVPKQIRDSQTLRLRKVSKRFQKVKMSVQTKSECNVRGEVPLSLLLTQKYPGLWLWLRLQPRRKAQKSCNEKPLALWHRNHKQSLHRDRANMPGPHCRHCRPSIIPSMAAQGTTLEMVVL